MKATANFIKAVLPETTLVQPKTESSVQTASSFSSPSIARHHLLMLSEVFETGPVAADDEVKGEVSEGDVRPIWVRTDRGKEFTNKSFQDMLKREGIQFQICKTPDIKCSVERAHRTIRDKLFKYHTFKNIQIYRRTP